MTAALHCFNTACTFLQLITLGLLGAILSCIINSNSEYGNDLYHNWNHGPLMSIYSSKSVVGCNKNDTFAFTDFWPGTVNGCKRGDIIFRGACGKGGGSGIDSLAPVHYGKWKGITLCGTRLTGSYFDLSLAVDARSCQEWEMPCGEVDSKNNILCMPKSSGQCPINYLTFIPTGQEYPNDVNITSTLNVSNGELISTTNGNGRIISEFRLSENTPCVNPYYTNTLVKPHILEVTYDIDRCLSPLGSVREDYRYTVLDIELKDTLYNDNGILNLLTHYAYYTPNYRTTINMYSRHYIGLSVECHKEVARLNLNSDIIQELSVFYDNTSLALALVTASIVLTCVSSFFFLFFFIMFICKPTDERDYMNTTTCCGIFTSIIDLASLILNCVHTGILYALIPNLRKILTDQTCVDEITYLAFSVNSVTISAAKAMSIICIIGKGIFISLNIGLAIKVFIRR